MGPRRKCGQRGAGDNAGAPREHLSHTRHLGSMLEALAKAEVQTALSAAG
jgi:hypothetical protein